MNKCFYMPLWIKILVLSLATAMVARTEQNITNVSLQIPTAAMGEVDEALEDIQLLAEAILTVHKYYFEKKSYKELVRLSLRGMIESLDPYSSFLVDEEVDDMIEGTSGQYGGIGIYIGIKDQVLTVISPIEDTPAYKAGLLAGDKIVQINDEKTTGMSLQDAIKRLKGEPGTKVKVTISRQGRDDFLEFELTRSNIEVPSVKGSQIIRDGIGYVRIVQFTETTAESLKTAVNKLIQEGMRALVIDLRNNPGGLLKSAVDVSQLFLPEDSVIVTTKGRDPFFKTVISRSKGKMHYDSFPIAILINYGSASASEIVAGALRDNKRAVLVGETSFGKGSVQTLLRTREDKKAAIKLTTALYYTPSGKQIHNKGIDPDIPVYLTTEEWRRILMSKLCKENPALYSEKEREEYANIVDKPLERAVDVLDAVCIFKNRQQNTD